MGYNKKDYTTKVPTDLLYMWSKLIDRVKSANRSHVGKGKSWSVPEIRFKSAEDSMFFLQYMAGRKGCGLLCKDVKGDRGRKNGTTTKRQTNNS